MSTVDMGRWQDAYVPRSGKTKVHLAPNDDPSTKTAICGQAIKPWTRPDPDSRICDRCLKKAHRPHRDHIANEAKASRRRGTQPGPGQTDITIPAADSGTTKKE